MLDKIDLLDRRIIYELDFNARMPLSQLAKKLHVSKQTVKNRIDKLLERNIILGFYTDISASKIGYEIYIVYFKFYKMSPEKEAEFINHMCSQKNIGVNISINGKWDYGIDIWARDVVEFEEIYRNAMSDWEKYVREKDIMIETGFYYFKPTQILNLKSNEMIAMEGPIERPELDATDTTILRKLSSNARVPLTHLAEVTGLTPNGVKARIKTLQSRGIILGYRVFINYQKLGFLHYRVFLHMESYTPQLEKKLIEYLKQNKTCPSITKTIGYCELEFRAVVSSVDEFYALMNDMKNTFPEIKEYESIIYAKMHGAWNYFPF
ncbi:Lrp/AsnC family transcriptional regulator [Candidatus Woesearchaeota archaeon]|nr:MAG: Lrp/AsnC family transcriptional regulator [Candidatus Woesearchaeota archaeon]